MTSKGLYIHIPFCIKKCNYCDFVSMPLKNEEDAKEYLFYLKKEIGLYKKVYKDKKFTSIYFGGGTPTLLNSFYLGELLKKIKKSFSIIDSPEITIEANPGTIDFESASYLKNAGFNRISIGIQETSDRLLKSMGRLYKKNEAFLCIENVKKAGFKNISVDLMYGLPGQKLSDFKKTLREIVSLGVQHLSIYGLKIEEGTNWEMLYKKGKIVLPDEEEVYNMYREAITYLKEKGFFHYEISNWAKPGFESKHNKVYWLNNEYLGLGLNASSSMDGKRFTNVADINEYKRMLQKELFPVNECSTLSIEEQMAETMILGLRLYEGVDKRLFKKRFNVMPEDIYEKQIKKLQKLRLLKVDDKRIYIPESKFQLANLAMVEFI